MDIKRGIAVSPGTAIGPALVLDTEGVRIPQRFIEPHEIDGEITRLRAALAAAARESLENQRRISERLGSQYGAIFAAHVLLLDDPGMIRELEAQIRDHRFSAEYALSRTMRRYAKALESLGADHLLASRSADLFDLEKRLLNNLLGQRREPLQSLREPVIVLAHDLMPSETAALDPQLVIAFATESGGRTSHTAIMAGALEIPAVVGLGKFITDVSGGDLIIVDGHQGLLIIDPDEETLRHYEDQRNAQRERATAWIEDRDLPCVTADGEPITLLGNIEFPSEAPHCRERGAAGVGLYRTEFLYVGKETHPTEEEHFAAYQAVIQALGPDQPVVIRTLDLGADKFLSYTGGSAAERNPFLGMRSVRLCLADLALFKTQLRAILRAGALGKVRILFPMVSTLLELRQCKMLLAEVKEDLEEEGIPFDPNMPIGTMIEVPSAALLADLFAREVDFFSIGTNDLVQYTLAADRTNENVAGLYNPADPAVLRLLRMVASAATQRGIEANVCGEMSGEPLYIEFLLGIGIRQFSVTPHNIPDIKKVIRRVNLTDAKRVAEEALQLEMARDVTNYLREQLRRLFPDGGD